MTDLDAETEEIITRYIGRLASCDRYTPADVKGLLVHIRAQGNELKRLRDALEWAHIYLPDDHEGCTEEKPCVLCGISEALKT